MNTIVLARLSVEYNIIVVAIGRGPCKCYNVDRFIYLRLTLKHKKKNDSAKGPAIFYLVLLWKPTCKIGFSFCNLFLCGNRLRDNIILLSCLMYIYYTSRAFVCMFEVNIVKIIFALKNLEVIYFVSQSSTYLLILWYLRVKLMHNIVHV